MYNAKTYLFFFFLVSHIHWKKIGQKLNLVFLLMTKKYSSGERTTNVHESFHSTFGKYFYSSHPTIFVFFYEVLNLIKNSAVYKENSIKSQIIYIKKKKTIGRRKYFKILLLKQPKYQNMFEFAKLNVYNYALFFNIFLET